MATSKNKGLESTLVALLRHDDELRRIASAVVIGEADFYSKEVVEGLRRQLKDGISSVRRHAAEALGRLAPDSLAHDLQPLIVDVDPEVREQVRQILATAKNIGPSDLQAMLDAKDDKERLGAVAVLCSRADQDSLELIGRHLPHASIKVLDALHATLPEALRRTTSEAREAFLESVRHHVEPTRLDERPALAEALSDILAGVDHDIVVRLLMSWCVKCKQPDARAAAAAGLRRLTSVRKLTSRQYEGLLEIVESPETPESVVGPVAEALVQADLPMAFESRVRKLTTAQARPIRSFAIGALGVLDSAPAARALATVVAEGEPSDRKQALQAAVQTPNGRTALARLLGSLQDEELVEAIAHALRTTDEPLVPATIQQLEQAALEASAGVSRIILSLLKQVGGESAGRVQGSLEERAKKLKNRGEYAEATKLYERVVAGTDDPGARFELGVCQLAMSKKVLSRGAKQDPAVLTFAQLARRRDFPTLDRLVAEPDLSPEALFFLGFSLAEGQGDAQNLGGDILSHLAESDQGPMGRRAKNKLVTMGWLE
ncbi:MAG: HEAT repeat domain-containing protein [Myxococcota bacterium]